MQGQSCIIGDVTVHPEAVLGTGVMLLAEPGSRVVVGAGVCLGAETILHAVGGLIDIQAEASLGCKVLVLGTVTIGERACVGSATTIFNTCVAPQAVVTANSRLGDTSRQLGPDVGPTSVSQVHYPPMYPLYGSGQTNPGVSDATYAQSVSREITTPNGQTPISGQVYVNQLLDKLLPHRQVLSSMETEP